MNDFDLRKYLAENKLLKENKIAQAIRDEAEQEDSKVGAAIFNKYAKKIESASKEDYRKILTSMERELIDTHPDTFDGDDDIVASFMAVAENKLLKEEIMVNPIIMFGGEEFTKGVITEPDDYGYLPEDAEWINSNILNAPKMMPLQKYMDLEDEWVKQADLDVGTGADREVALDGIDVHIEQGLITPEEGEEAKEIILSF